MSDRSTLHVLIVDDHQLIAQSCAIALQLRGVHAEVADLDDPERLLEQVRRDVPDLVLLDLELGGAIGDGESLVPQIVAAGSRVLVLSASTDQHRFATAVERGAVGMLVKSVPFDLLLTTILDAARGGQVLAPGDRRALLTELHQDRAATRARLAPFELLTCREQQVLGDLADGRCVATIAAACCVSEATVRSQVRSILAKLEVRSQLEAVAYATRVGWFSRPDAPSARRERADTVDTVDTAPPRR